MTPENLVAVLTRRRELRDQVLTMTATAGLLGDPVDSVEAVLAVWHRAALVVIGADLAAAVNDAGPPRRRDVYLVGAETDTPTLMRSSGPLGAVVVLLPGGAETLSGALGRLVSGGSGSGTVISVIGGSGGVGASTMAAAVTLAATRRSLNCALVDLDPLGGGLDLLMGAEHQPGWRWPRLTGVGGRLPDLAQELVGLDGAGLLSMDRGRGRPPSEQQIDTLLDAAGREFGLTVVDLPRLPGPPVAGVIRRSALLVVVARADVRAFAATRQVLGGLPEPSRLALVVRGPGLDADTYAARLGAELIGVVREEAAVRRDVERGVAPGRHRRSGLARAADRVVDLVGSAAGPSAPTTRRRRDPVVA